METGRKKIAILGGGPAGIAAAFELTRDAESRSRFEVTVYQVGWRLGGKCASGRNPDLGYRIEEHGLHVLGGCYDATFRLLRQCYQEWSPPAGSHKWKMSEAFCEQRHVTLMEKQSGGTFLPWEVEFDRRPGVPGDEISDPGLWGLLKEALFFLDRYNIQAIQRLGPSLLQRNLEAAAGEFHGEFGDLLNVSVQSYPAPESTNSSGFSAQPHGPGESGHEPVPERAVSMQKWQNALGLSAALAWEMAKREARQGTTLSSDHDEENFGKIELEARLFINHALQTYKTNFDATVPPLLTLSLEKTVSGQKSFDSSHWPYIADIGAAIGIGFVSDIIPFGGFDHVDALDFREWLMMNGASHKTVHSAVVNPGYDYAFAYEDGDTTDPRKARLSAGVAVNAFLRLLLGYKGALFYQMQASMAELVFTPLYDVLRDRGVQFNFFHRVDALNVGQDNGGLFIESVDIGLQALPNGSEYDPLIEAPIKGNIYRCWPSQPKTRELQNGAALNTYIGTPDYIPLDNSDSRSKWPDARRVTLRAGDQYDEIVLAIPVAELARICPQLIESSPEWLQMVAKVKTVATTSMQLWFSKTTSQLGWRGKIPTIMTSFAQPLSTWADMTHLSKVECVPATHSIAYFCGPFDQRDAVSQQQEPGAAAGDWTLQLTNNIWPKEKSSGVGAPDSGFGTGLPDLVWPPHLRTNTNRSDQYVLSLPGSTRYRLRPDESGFANLYLAGDWTRSAFNIGCVEDAVRSGLEAGIALKSPDGELHDGDLFENLTEIAVEAVEGALTVAETGVEVAAGLAEAALSALAEGLSPRRRS